MKYWPKKVVPLPTTTLRKPIRDYPTNEQQAKLRSRDICEQRMNVMGYFGAWNDNYDENDEKLLFEVKLIGKRTLQVSSFCKVYSNEF